MSIGPPNDNNNNNNEKVTPALLQKEKDLDLDPIIHGSGIEVDTRNAFSGQIESMEREGNKTLSRIAAVDTVMRGPLALVSEIIDVKIAILQELQLQVPEERDFDGAQRELNERLTVVEENNVEDYCGLLEQRDNIMEDGKEIHLTEDKKEELRTAWRDEVQKVRQEVVEGMTLTAETNLDALETSLRETKETKLESYYRMMDSKTELTNRLFQLYKQVAGLEKIRDEKLVPKAKDIFEICSSGNLEAVQEFIKPLWPWQKKKTLNVLNPKGFAPLHLACIKGHREVVKLLLDNNASSCLEDGTGYHPLHWTAKFGHVEVAKELFSKKALVNADGEYGRKPIHMACYNGHVEMVHFLIESGAEMNAQTGPDDNKKTPLHDAVMLANHKMILCLVGYEKLDVMICDSLGLSPLAHAIESGNIEITTLIAGHKSWKETEDKESPNHRDNLLKIIPRQNAEEMKALLKNLI